MVRLSNFLFDVSVFGELSIDHSTPSKRAIGRRGGKKIKDFQGTTEEKRNNKNDSTLNWPLNSAQMFNEDFLSCSRNCLRYDYLRYIYIYIYIYVRVVLYPETFFFSTPPRPPSVIFLISFKRSGAHSNYLLCWFFFCCCCCLVVVIFLSLGDFFFFIFPSSNKTVMFSSSR